MPLSVEHIQRLQGREVIRLMERLYGMDYCAAEFAIMGEEGRVNGARTYGTAKAGVARATREDLASRGTNKGWDTDDLLSDFCARGELEPGDYEILYEY